MNDVIDVDHETRNLSAEIERPARAASWALATMSDEQFDQQMAMLKVGRQRLQKVMKASMQVDVHYGKVPGTDKDTLFQPGADMLLKMFNLVPEPITEIQYGDGKTSPQITVKARCLIHAGQIDGPVVAIGEAAAASWEKKWRYRNEDRKCPSCGKPAIKRSKFPPRDEPDAEPGWYCYGKIGGCGANFSAGDPAIIEQVAGQVENPDQFDLLNTIVKIANKRAKVHGAIAATDSSDLLTQDLEEQPHEQPKTDKPKAPAQPSIDPRLKAAREAVKEAKEVAKSHGLNADGWTTILADFPQVKGNDLSALTVAQLETLATTLNDFGLASREPGDDPEPVENEEGAIPY